MRKGWTMLLSFDSSTDAHLARSKLESEEILAFLKDEHVNQVFSSYPVTYGGIKLYVRDDDVERAAEIMVEGGFVRLPIKREKPKIVRYSNPAERNICPYCQSDHIGKGHQTSLWTALVTFTIGVIFPIPNTVYKCYECDKEWRFKKAK